MSSSSHSRFQQLAGRLRTGLSFWSRSLLLRVVALTLIISTIVMVGVGLILQSEITKKLLESKTQAAVAAVSRAADSVSTQMVGATSDDTSLEEALARELDELGNPSRSTSSGSDADKSAGSFEPVILPLRPGGTDLAAGPIGDIPLDLQDRVAAGYQAWNYSSVVRNSVQIPVLVVGSPAATATDNFSVFLIFPLTFEQSTVAVVQTTLLLGGAGLAIALAFIAVLVALQVVGPVRRAAAVARRLAGGDLAERMPVRGPVELITLARSFNGMADAIRAQIRQLEEFGKLQRRFTSDVSHELRTPVTTVRMAADFLHANRYELPPHLGRSTELLVTELDRFESLLGDLLEISRHDAGMAELAAEPMDIRSVITVSVEAATPLAEKAGVSFRVDLPDEQVVAEIDNRRVERIMRNLINNAIDHAEGGVIIIELAADDHAVAIAVTDHGVGLKPGEAALVFNRFWRADSSRQRQTGGTGLGLAISLEDARLHGGWLQASGLPGVGARFRLTLPRKKGALVDLSPLPLRINGDQDDDAHDDDAGDNAGPDLALPAVVTDIDPRQVVLSAGGQEP